MNSKNVNRTVESHIKPILNPLRSRIRAILSKPIAKDGLSITSLRSDLNSPKGFDKCIEKMKIEGEIFLISGDRVKLLW